MPDNHTLVFANFKGGIGKTSLSTAYAMERNLTLYTNDLLEQFDRIDSINVIKLPTKKKRIDSSILHSSNIVYDFGSTHGSIDLKLADALKHCDGLVIPTLTDSYSLNSTLAFIKAVKPYITNIVVVINKVSLTKKKRKHYDEAVRVLSVAVPASHILPMKETTLYSRIAKDGSQWYMNIEHEMGAFQLQKARSFQNELFHKIDELVIAGNRMY